MHEENPAPALDPEKTDRLRQMALAAFVDQGTAEVVAALAHAAIPSIVLRGPVIATWLYENPLERPYGDVDLLVHPDRLEAARGVLAELGFTKRLLRATPHDHTLHDEAWLRDAFFVDLHRTLSGAGAAPSAVWGALSREPSNVVIGDAELPAPAFPGRLLVVVLHAGHHGIEFVKPLEDLRRAVNQVALTVWQDAAAVAREIDATAAFAAGLRLLPESSALAEKLELSSQASVEATLRATSAPPMALALEWLAHGPLTVRQKLAFVARKLVPPPAFLRDSSRLAKRGVVGLAAAYLVRFGKLAGRLPGGVRALRRARRETRT